VSDCLGCGVEVSAGLLQVKRDPAGRIGCDTTGLFLSPNSATAFVVTTESTSSTAFTDLATPGPSVSIMTGTKALVIFDCIASVTDAPEQAFMSVAVSGATAIPASVLYSIQCPAAQSFTLGYGVLFTTLNPGLNTFTAKYACNGFNSATFARRRLSALG
jgi:hypothetical protein